MQRNQGKQEALEEWAAWEAAVVVVSIFLLKPMIAFGNKKSQMIFIHVREGFVDPLGIEKMAKDFQAIMSTGGIQVGIVGIDNNQMIAIANNIKELIEIRKFAVQMEQVLKVEYEKTSFPGKYITEEERKKNNLRDDDNKDDL